MYRAGVMIAACGLALALVFGFGYQRGAAAVNGEWQVERTRQAEARVEAGRQARAKEHALRDKVEKARKDAEEREEKLAADAAAADAAAAGLRKQVAWLRAGLSEATAEANRRTADAALDVFQQCADEYRSVAAAADQHASDALTFSDAWPSGQ